MSNETMDFGGVGLHIGGPGPRGYSAYDIAVQNGYSGTEEEWIASLYGTIDKNLSTANVAAEAKATGDAIAAEKTEREAGDAAMGDRISTESANRAASDTTLENRMNALQAAVGSPLQAATKAAMTDENKIYVYTGSETGMTNGNWYFYDGSDWVSGGVYNAVAINTDTTLTVSGKAADAKAVGDRIIKGRSDISLDSMARFYGTITSSVTEMPDFTWIERTGSELSGLLGSNFTGGLISGTVYILRKYRIGPSTSQTKRYELMAIGGDIIFVGYETANTTDIVWVDWRTDTSLTKSGKAADAKAAGTYIFNLSDVLDQISIDGENLFHLTKSVQTVAGVTFTQNNDGTITINGSTDSTTRAYVPVFSDREAFTEGGTYRWGLQRVTDPAPTGPGLYLQYLDGDTWELWSSSSPLTVPSGGYKFRLGVDLNTSFPENTIYRMCAVSGSVLPDYLPSYTKTAVDCVARENLFSVTDSMEPGTMITGNGGSGFGYSSFWHSRKMSKLLEVGTAPVHIYMSEKDAAAVSSASIYEYGIENNVVTFKQKETITISNGSAYYVPPKGVKYIKLSLYLTSSTSDHFGEVTFRSADRIKLVGNPDIRNPNSGNNVTFAFLVSGDVYTSGQMILPPNYTVDGKPVPLYINVHGTGQMTKWDEVFAASERRREIFQYMANEGFAVMDIYPWTSKYYSTTKQISPVNLPVHQRAYIEAIKYVCTRYNIDIDNVCLSFKSLGGNIGHFFMKQTEIPVRALAMLAPSTSFASTIWSTLFLFNSDGGETLRSRIVEILGLQSDSDAQTFVTTNYGMLSTTVMNFVRRHLDKFASLNCAGVGVNGATYEQIFDWSVTGVTTLPTWMSDKGIVKWPDDWETFQSPTVDPNYPSYLRGIGAPAIIEHPELSVYSPYPVKFWQAQDDVNTSFHGNYTFYQWLLNGGSDADFRIVPSGTGGHSAVDLSDDAEKVSGTTRLGITYSDITKTYVEMADFFYDKMVM